MPTTNLDAELLVRLVRVARGLEAEGQYNAAKLCWGLVFSEQIRASNRADLPRLSSDLDQELQWLIGKFQDRRYKPEIAQALETARKAAQESRTLDYNEIPAVAVCRFCGELMMGEIPERCSSCWAHHLTFQQPLATYYFNPMSPSDVIKALETGPDLVQQAMNGLSETQMNQVPRTGEWSIRELVLHLLMAHQLLAGRAEKLLTQDNPSLAASAAWNLESDSAASTGDIYERYREARQNLLDKLKQLQFEDWWRAGWHDEFGRVTLLDQATYFARHEHGHLTQFDFIRKAIGA